MAEGKWISDLQPTTPPADAARHVLTVRLGVVRDYLPLAVRRPEEDPEYVHQLRVGTRRAGAALEIFRDCLPEKVHRAARKWLRQIRRAAGEARDWDVFLIALAGWRRRSERQRPGLDFLIGYASGRRAAAQTHLEEANADFPFDFDRLLAETVASVHRPRGDPESRTLLDMARPMLAGLLEELDQAAARDLDDYDNLHQVRIAGKRLRYAMELFADCFAPPFREQLYPAVEQMQDILGLANDSHVACRRLGQLRQWLRAARPDEWKRYRAGVGAVLRFHERRLPREQGNFLEWWKRWQESGAEAALADLVRPADPAAVSLGQGVGTAGGGSDGAQTPPR
jgi:CHAD domain-containing protein